MNWVEVLRLMLSFLGRLLAVSVLVVLVVGLGSAVLLACSKRRNSDDADDGYDPDDDPTCHEPNCDREPHEDPHHRGWRNGRRENWVKTLALLLLLPGLALAAPVSIPRPSVPFRSAPSIPRAPVTSFKNVQPAPPVVRGPAPSAAPKPVSSPPRASSSWGRSAPAVPLPSPRASFYQQRVASYAAPAAAPVYIDNGPPWWYWYMIFNSNKTTHTERTQLVEDRRDWTRKGECFRCHHCDEHGKTKPQGAW